MLESNSPNRRPPVLDKEAAILDAGLKLFSERGFHGTAVPLVAEAAGVAAGTIYRYFPSKEVLVNAVFQRAKRQLQELLLGQLQLNAPPREQFHQVWQGLVRYARDNPLGFRFLEMQDHAPYLDDSSRNLEQATLKPIWNLCDQARQAGLTPDLPAEALMALVWGAFVGLFKAELLGYLTLSERDLAVAEEACWQAVWQPRPAP